MGRKKLSVNAKVLAEEIFDDILTAYASPGAPQKIGAEERKLLRRIKVASLDIPKEETGGREYEIAPDHDDFEYFVVDSATVYIALAEPHAKEFFAPLIGGRKYLEHMTRCEYCLASVAEERISGDTDVREDILEVVSKVFGIAHSAGIKIDFGAKTVRGAFKLPVKH